MKKLLLAIICLVVFGSAVYAATQYHSIGSVQASTSTFTGSVTVFMLPKASIATLTPATTGQLVLCQDCGGGNNGTYNICISTGLTSGGFLMVSTATTVLGCR